MAGRYPEEYAYAFLRRWDNLTDRWEDQFREDALVEVIFQGRATLVCGTHNAPQSVRTFRTVASNCNLILKNV